jgi:hypothetical protein
MWEFAECLKESLDELLDNPNEMQSILKWNTRVKGRDIDSSLSEFAIEKESERGFVHGNSSEPK